MRPWTTVRMPLGDFWRRHSGQSLIETAFVLPVVLLMTLGFITFCLMIFNIGNANFASRALIRYASLHSLTAYTPATAQSLRNIASSYIYSYPANTYTVAVSYYTPSASNPNNGTNTVGSGVFVTMNIAYTVSILGHTYSPISYSTTAVGIVLQ